MHNKFLLINWLLIKKINLIFGVEFTNKIKLIFLKFLIHLGFSNSQNRIDKKILKLFNNKKNGFFIEVGAFDGINYSNTFLLEKKHNWKGLLVEPLKAEFEICKKYRTKSIVVNNILSNPKDMNKLIKLHHSGLESLIVDRNNSLMPKRHLDEKIKTKYIHIKSVTLDHLLDIYRINYVDILIVDVEGFEINLLDGFSQDHKVNYILIETYNNQRLIEYCKKRSWKFIEKFTDNDYLFKVSKKN
jgi:FkbM family methyltransferase